MQQTEERAGKRGLRGTHYGWVMVGNGAVVNAIGSVHAATFPIFFLPLQEEFKVGSAALAFVLTMARVQGGIEGPLVGWFIDRTGPRLPAVLAASSAEWASSSCPWPGTTGRFCSSTSSSYRSPSTWAFSTLCMPWPTCGLYATGHASSAYSHPR